MQSFSVTSPTDDLALLTIEELRAAAGVTDDIRDDDLTALGAQIALTIARACRVKADGAIPVTLLQESCEDTFWRPCSRALILSRSPVVNLAAVTADGVELSEDEYMLDASSGILRRLSGGYPSHWSSGKIVVTYDAGYDVETEGNLKLAATKLVQMLWTEATRDPGLKRVTVDGVGEREYWVAPTSDTLIPAEVMDLLRPYMAAPAI